MFKSSLRLKHKKGTRLFVLTSPLVYETWDGVIRTTPAGFVIDGHSYPGWTDAFVGNPIACEVVEASVNHDHDREDPEIPDALADKWYSQAMSDLGWNFKENGWKGAYWRKRNWVGVRVGAFWNWLKRKK